MRTLNIVLGTVFIIGLAAACGPSDERDAGDGVHGDAGDGASDSGSQGFVDGGANGGGGSPDGGVTASDSGRADAGREQADSGSPVFFDGGQSAPTDSGDGATDSGSPGAVDGGHRQDAGQDAGGVDRDAGAGDGGASKPDSGFGAVDGGVGVVDDAGVGDAGPLVPAQGVLLNTFGGPVGFGASMLPAGDDASSSPISILPVFPIGLNFYGTFHSSLYVNINGTVSLSAPASALESAPLTSQLIPAIAPYSADVDTRGGGMPNTNAVFWTTSTGMFVVTWHNVGYYNMHDDLACNFQLIIRERSDIAPGDFDVEFRYDRVEWTTGDASGGVNGLGGDPAQIGFAAGDGTQAVQLPGSGTIAVQDVALTSNVGEVGVWRISFRSGQPM